MSRSKVVDYQETLEDLQEQLSELKKQRLFYGRDPIFGNHIIDIQIKALEERIRLIRQEIYFQNHPNLRKYRIHFQELPLLIAYFLAEVSIIWIYVVISSNYPNLELVYRLFCIICAPIFLFFGARQYHNFVRILVIQSKFQIEYDYPKLFLEIENSVSQQ